MKRLILYDLDGTLVDTLQDITIAANHMLAQLCLPALTADEVKPFVGRGVLELIARCLNTDGSDAIDHGMHVYRAYYGQHLMDHSRLYPGARELLEHFTPRLQGVVTNKPNPYSTQLLEGLGVAGYFLEIIGGEGTYPRKPSPAGVQALMARAQAAADDTVFIGDSAVDVETGRRAGIMTVTVGHGLGDESELRAAQPDRFVADFAELLALVREEAW